MTDDRLREHWVLLAGTAPPALRLGDELVRRYAEPHRRYHDAVHLREVLDRVEELAEEAAAPDAVRFAAWFHDAVYDPAAGGNEEASAALAEERLTAIGLGPALVAQVARLVRLTAGHNPDPGDSDGAVLCDADLAILGSGPGRYAEYAAAVREEYGFVPDEAFRSGRAAVLRALLDAPVLFRTRAGNQAYEERARRNMATELSLLEARTSGGAAPPR